MLCDYTHPEQNSCLFGSIVTVNIYFHFRNTKCLLFSVIGGLINHKVR